MSNSTNSPTSTHDSMPAGENNRPDWVVKIPRGAGRQSRLERIGVAWNRDDGGIGVRLSGTQIVDEDIYLYPNDMQS